MRQPNLLSKPRDLPASVAELCAHLEEHGVRTSSHGEGLLDDLRVTPVPPRPPTLEGEGHARFQTRSLLCVARAAEILRALPHAVMTGENGQRITQATAFGPIDLIPTGRDDRASDRGVDGASPGHGGTGVDAELQAALLRFGLGPLSLAFRPADESWCDPSDQLAALRAGRFELATREPNPFEVAPRRFWMAARLIAERDLEPDADVLAAALEAFPRVSDRLPQGAPARRELMRVVAAKEPARALAFLRASGVSGFLFPGTLEANEARVGDLPEHLAIRWAAWLRGSATSRALVRLRMPHALARRIERIQGSHPIERSVQSGRDLGVRKLLQRHDQADIEALFAWRRLEINDPKDPLDAGEIETQLAGIEERIVATRAAASRTNLVRALAIDGEAVMRLLDAGPGRHVGQALAHLARFIADEPDSNVPEALEVELRSWARTQTNLLD